MHMKLQRRINRKFSNRQSLFVKGPALLKPLHLHHQISNIIRLQKECHRLVCNVRTERRPQLLRRIRSLVSDLILHRHLILPKNVRLQSSLRWLKFRTVQSHLPDMGYRFIWVYLVSSHCRGRGHGSEPISNMSDISLM